MVKYIRSDLEFILDQIKIAEAHSAYLRDPNDPAGKPLFGPNGSVPAYNIAWGLRTVDGTYNNLLNPETGAADNEFPEHLGTRFPHRLGRRRCQVPVSCWPPLATRRASTMTGPTKMAFQAVPGLLAQAMCSTQRFGQSPTCSSIRRSVIPRRS